MKRIVVLIYSSLSIICCLSAQDRSVLERITEAYKAQDYTTVISIGEQTIAEGLESAELYYNIGNAYYKQNDLPKAILYYEKALLLAPNDKDIKYNLAFANSQQPDNIEHLSLGFLPRMYQKLYRISSVDTWAIIGIIFSIIFSISVCIFLFSQMLTRKKIAFTTLLCSLVFAIISFCCAESRYTEITAHEYAIVIEPTTSIKTEPITTAMDLATIHGGIKVKIIGNALGWFKVELGNGKEGWILAENVERI